MISESNAKIMQYFQLRLKTHELSQDVEIFNTIKQYKSLKKFEYNFGYSYTNTKPHNMLSEELKECQDLTHLTLSGCKIRDIFFKDIGLYLPKLQYLNLSNIHINESSFKELSNLSDLRSLQLHIPVRDFKFNLINPVLDKCHKIRFIYLTTYGLNVPLVLDELKIKALKENKCSVNELIENRK